MSFSDSSRVFVELTLSGIVVPKVCSIARERMKNLDNCGVNELWKLRMLQKCVTSYFLPTHLYRVNWF